MSPTDHVSEDAIAPAEYAGRLEAVRSSLAQAGLRGLVAFGDCWRSANISYFTEFRPLDGVSDIANAVFLLGRDADPLLLVSDQCLDYARSVTPFEVCSLSELSNRVARIFPAGTGLGTVGLAGAAYVPATVLDRVRSGLGSVALEPTAALAEVKAVKSEAEVRLLRKAAALTDAAMAAIRDRLQEDGPHTERDLALAADRAMLAGGADRTAYDTMVQAGPRSAYNLARPTDRRLEPGDLVMTDIGARYRGYVADGGRGFTYGPADDRRRAIVSAAAAAVEAGLAAARPGLAASDLNAVIQGSIVASGFAEYSSEARGHGTGHGTGMDPEEEAPWIGPGNRTVLRENMVFTLKATITVPGIGGLRTERIVRLARDGVEALDRFPMELHW